MILLHTGSGSFDMFTLINHKSSRDGGNFWRSIGIYYLTDERKLWSKFIATVFVQNYPLPYMRIDLQASIYMYNIFIKIIDKIEMKTICFK